MQYNHCRETDSSKVKNAEEHYTVFTLQVSILGMYGEGVMYNSGMTILQKSHGYTTGDAMKLPHEQRVRNYTFISEE